MVGTRPPLTNCLTKASTAAETPPFVPTTTCPMNAITKPDKIVWITGEEEQLDALREQGEHIGIATVYRQLEKLER